MRIETEEWPEQLKAACKERCAEKGEPSCWEIDEWINPRDPDRGLVCEECQAECAAEISTIAGISPETGAAGAEHERALKSGGSQ